LVGVVAIRPATAVRAVFLPLVYNSHLSP